MRILFMTPQWRFWEHFLPVMGALKVDGHQVVAAVQGPDPDGPTVAMMARGISFAGASVRVRHRKQSAGRFVGDLTAEAWDAVVLCAEHMNPMCLVKPALRARGRQPPVLAMQHGLCQVAARRSREWCDVFLCWGVLGGQLIASSSHAVDSPLYVTGTARFDSYREQDAEDDGFLLACAPSPLASGSRCTEDWLEGVLRAAPAGLPVVVKIHPNDRHTDANGLAWTNVRVAGYTEDPRELLRTCSALYLDYPSTYWLEARCFGKPVICDGQAEILRNRPIHDVLLAQGAAAVRNIIHVIETEVEKTSFTTKDTKDTKNGNGQT